MTDRFLAEFELYVLLAVAQTGEEAYGVSIRRCIEDRTGRSVAVGALYTTLSRLENKGFLEFDVSTKAEGRRGRPRRYCSLTEAGHEAVSHSLSMIDRMAEGVALQRGGSA